MRKRKRKDCAYNHDLQGACACPKLEPIQRVAWVVCTLDRAASDLVMSSSNTEALLVLIYREASLGFCFMYYLYRNPVNPADDLVRVDTRLDTLLCWMVFVQSGGQEVRGWPNKYVLS